MVIIFDLDKFDTEKHLVNKLCFDTSVIKPGMFAKLYYNEKETINCLVYTVDNDLIKLKYTGTNGYMPTVSISVRDLIDKRFGLEIYKG